MMNMSEPDIYISKRLNVNVIAPEGAVLSHKRYTSRARKLEGMDAEICVTLAYTYLIQ